LRLVLQLMVMLQNQLSIVSLFFRAGPRRDSECEKWLKGRVRTTPLAESTRADVIQSVTQFLSPRSQTQVRTLVYCPCELHRARSVALEFSSCCLLLLVRLCAAGAHCVVRDIPPALGAAPPALPVGTLGADTLFFTAPNHLRTSPYRSAFRHPRRATCSSATKRTG
jgi:hypothetical protein